MSSKFHNQKILDQFGALLVREVRDSTVRVHSLIMDGKMNSKENLELHQLVASESSEKREIAERYVRNAVDNAIHNFLWMIEQYEEFDLIYRDGDKVISLRDISDGLCGEPLTEEGWIARFSKYPPSIE